MTGLTPAQVAAEMLACPYLVAGGTCVTGCWSEPACITDEPSDGWASLLAEEGQ